MKKFFYYFTIFFSINLFSYQIDLKEGWNLVGATEDIITSNIVAKDSCADFVWSYQNGKDNKWSLYVINDENFSYTTFPKLIKIKKGDGFWIRAKKDCTIETKKIRNMPIKENPYYKYMWNINPDSIVYKEGDAKKGADINITPAWQKTFGSDIYVAVIDDCFNAYHEDLKDNIKLTYNANFGTTDVNIHNRNNCHGTEVASVLGAVNNDKGIVGVAPRVKLLLISVDFINSSEATLIKAFEYAKQKGAKVINCSWGSYNSSEALHEEFKKIKDSNITIVFATGNDNIDLDEEGYNDESEDPNVIGVGATDETNDVSLYSNYGSNIDILAPGGYSIGILVASRDDYGIERGTSFSAPQVSGAIALKLSLNPNFIFDDIRDCLIHTADKVGIENGAKYIDGFNIYRAYGKINVGSFIND